MGSGGIVHLFAIFLFASPSPTHLGHAPQLLQVRPLLEAMGRGIIDVGHRPELGHALKLCGNFWITSVVELIAESMTLSDASGDQKLMAYYQKVIWHPSLAMCIAFGQA